MSPKAKDNDDNDNRDEKFENDDESLNIRREQDITKFISKLLKDNVDQEDELEKERVRNFKSLLAVNSEWLDTFMIIGYDLNGEEIVLSRTKTQKEYNALMHLLKKAFMSLIVKNEE